MEKILVIDDENQVVRLLQKFLSSKGYDVYTATSGLEGVQRAQEVNPRVIFLDIIMPGMGGLDTLKEIKKTNPESTVIMLTALIDEELAKRALKLGADDYITKPIDLNYIETTLIVKMIQLMG